MMRRAFLDHVAVGVGDIERSLDVFTRVLGMKETRRQERDGRLFQVWLDGGVQLVAAPDEITDGHSRHLGIVLDDFNETVKALLAEPGVRQIDGAPATWVQLPEGLVLELFPAVAGSIEKVQRIQINSMLP